MDDALLLLGLAAPLAGALGAVLAGGPQAGRRLQRAGCVLAAIAWAVLAARGRFIATGWFHTTPLLAAVGCGAALLAASEDDEPASRRSLVAGALALTALLAGLAAGERQVSALPLMIGLAVCAASTLAVAGVRQRDTRPAVLAVALGFVLVGVAFLLLHDSSGGWRLPPGGSTSLSEGAALAFLGGAAALAGAGTLQAGRTGAVFVAGGLAVGLLAAPLGVMAAPVTEPGAGDGLLVAVVVLAVAAAAAAAAGRAVLAFALLSLALAAGPPAFLGASRLMAAAAVLVLAVDRRPAWLLGLPAGVAVALVATEAAGGVAIGLGAATGVVAALLALVGTAKRSSRRAQMSVVDPRPPWGVPDLGALPAALAGAWLLVAPATWSWTGPTGLDAYDSSAARATAAGLLAVIVVALSDQLRHGGISPPPVSHTSAPPAPPEERFGPPPEFLAALAGEAGPSGPVRAGEAGPSGPVRAGEAGPDTPPPMGVRRLRRRRERRKAQERGLP